MHRKRLDSWKAIADFLGRSLRTVQRWHDLNGLPVHHYGGRKGSVFAYEEEIDQWLAGLAEGARSSLSHMEESFDSGKQNSRELTSTADRMWETRSERNIQTIADLYRKAIDLDAGNGGAFAGLANAMIFCALNEIMDGSIAYPCAVEALRQIPQHEARRPEARCAEAWLEALHYRNWRQAKVDFDEVISRQPSSFALAGRAALHIADGRTADALECAWEAWRLSPLVRSLCAYVCWVLYLGGDFRQVADLIGQIRAGGGDGALVTSVEALLLVQDEAAGANLARLEEMAQEMPFNQTVIGCLGYAYGVLGEGDKARRKLHDLAHSPENRRKGNGYAMALICMGLNDREQAASWLEAVYAEGTLWSLGLRSDPMFRPLRKELKFERLLDRLGTLGAFQPAVQFPVPPSNRFLGRALVTENS